MTQAGADSGAVKDKSVSTLAREFSELAVTYAKQETVDPLRDLGRFVGWGFAGALLIATGGVILTLATVRAIQTETGRHLHGELTWVPYAGGILLALVGAGWSVSRIWRGLR